MSDDALAFSGLGEGADERLPASLRRVVQFLIAIENWLGLFFAILLVLTFAGLIEFMLEGDIWSLAHRWMWIAVAGMWLLLDVPYIWRLAFTAYRHQSPFAMHVAAQQWVPPLLLRPLVVLWWLAHFAAAVSLGAMMHDMITKEPVLIVLVFAMAACYAYAANGFLMLAVHAFSRSPRLRWTIWRWRFLTDLGLASLSLLPWGMRIR